MPPFHLPTNLGNADVQIFTCANNNNFNLSTYFVPRGKSMLYIYAVGSGGGGGGGFTGAAASARGGGGGGASGVITTLLVPTCLLPTILYVRVHTGGAGGLVGTGNALSGNASEVYLTNGTTIATIEKLLTANGGNAGNNGSATAGGTGGSLVSANTAANMPLCGAGVFNSIISQSGSNGGAHTGNPGVTLTVPTSGANVMGGTGGGGVTGTGFAGGLISGSAGSLITQSIPTTAGIGGHGSGGFSLPNLMYHFPGLGGGSSNAGVGGDGGNGGYGCGGGGGGGGTTGGRGGDGGSGLVVMIAW